MSRKNRKARNGETIVQAHLTAEQAAAVKHSRVRSIIRRASEEQVKLSSPSKFFKTIDQPVESRLGRWLGEVKERAEEHLDTRGYSRLVEVDPASGRWRWRRVRTWAQFKAIMAESEKAYDKYLQLREAALVKGIMSREFDFGGQVVGGRDAFPVRPEYTPLIGTPFYKQLYLYDYWEMHSKCFWYSNYSAIGKMVVDITRNFVMGDGGFQVVFSGENEKVVQQAEDAWKSYEERSGIQDAARLWCDDLTKFGENMIRRVPTANGLLHRSFDPSICWEIVTDPEDIQDVKYYHNQWNTQYQIYTAKDAPSSKYIIQQLPPQLVIHTKVNTTAFEKRGRADLLAPLLYFKYYEDYMQCRLIRAKNEAAFIWDVTVKGGQEDIDAYIAGTESMVDVPPGSENVHNEAIERSPMAPDLSSTQDDRVAADILSMVAMGTTIPVTYFGIDSSGVGNTKAGALVATEPVVKKMGERQNKMRGTIGIVVRDILKEAKIDLKAVQFEIIMPEILEGDRAQKIDGLYESHRQGVYSHKTMSQMVAKELGSRRYDYDKEQRQIKKEQSETPLFRTNPDDSEAGADLTGDEDDPQNQGQRKPRSNDTDDARKK